ncbi:MAG: exodeoxyribonuclease large subunit [Halanaerobiales bacterium]|nr:exodeoxyribonuclease large subunit [Halanaerobiales bacterium]
MEYKTFTISEITNYIQELLTGDPLLNDLYLTGEISNYHHHSSGHMYFTLKDDSASINAIMFRSNNQHLKFALEDGLKVNAHGYISLYRPRGIYQFYVDKIEPAGKGALYLAFEQLKARLEKEGLFAAEHKKDIPLLPKKIGIVTSPTGAAIRDILSVVRRRFDNVSVLIVPSLVQGEQAADQIVRGIEYLNLRDDIDLIILSRGGGSIEDLWPFNEEKVARAIYNSKIPVISGVGHETDFTIADFVADLRAPTPSAAAELAISSRLELEKNLAGIYTRLCKAVQYKIENYQERVAALARKRIFTNPVELVASQFQQLDDLSRRLQWGMEKTLAKNQERFRILNGKLESLSPLKTLARGYSITTAEGRVIKDISQVEVGDLVSTRVKDGVIFSRVEGKKKEGGLDV